MVRVGSRSMRRFVRLWAAFCQNKVRCFCGVDVFRAVIAQCSRVEPCEEVFARAKEHRTDGEMGLLNEAGLQGPGNRCATPPPSLTSIPFATSKARPSAAWMPSVTK